MFGFHAYDKMLKHFQTYFHKKIKKKKASFSCFKNPKKYEYHN